MRFDTPIYFVTRGELLYDTDTGDYMEGDSKEELAYADITDPKESALTLVYGKVMQGAKTVRVRKRTDSFDFIRIDGKLYKADSVRQLRRFTAYMVTEARP